MVKMVYLVSFLPDRPTCDSHDLMHEKCLILVEYRTGVEYEWKVERLRTWDDTKTAPALEAPPSDAGLHRPTVQSCPWWTLVCHPAVLTSPRPACLQWSNRQLAYSPQHMCTNSKLHSFDSQHRIKYKSIFTILSLAHVAQNLK